MHAHIDTCMYIHGVLNIILPLYLDRVPNICMLHSNVKESTLFRSRSRFQGTIIQDLKIWLTVLLATMEGARQRQARAHRHRRYLADKERHSSMGRRFEEVQAELAALRQARGFFFSSAGPGSPGK